MTSAHETHQDAAVIQASLLKPGETVRASAPGYRWVYLWHWPIRAMHWVAAASIILLTVSGFFIGRPYFFSGTSPSGFAIQYMRLTHFVFAALLTTTMIVRLYWLLAGNRYERWNALFPVKGRDLKNLVQMVRYYLLIKPEKGPHYLGHNPLQQMSYTFTYLMAFVLVVTGFILFGQAEPNGIIAAMTLWMAPHLGGLQMVRTFHHVVAWWFPMFFILHVYLATRSDLMELQGNMSAIISGGRYVPSDAHYVDG